MQTDVLPAAQQRSLILLFAHSRSDVTNINLQAAIHVRMELVIRMLPTELRLTPIPGATVQPLNLQADFYPALIPCA